MQTIRSEFSKATREQAWQRAGGKCEICTQPFAGRRPEYHHRIPCGLNGDNSLSNCRVICVKCHRELTANEDRPSIIKAKRIEAKGANLMRPRTVIPSRPFAREYTNHRRKEK